MLHQNKKQVEIIKKVEQAHNEEEDEHMKKNLEK